MVVRTEELGAVGDAVELDRLQLRPRVKEGPRVDRVALPGGPQLEEQARAVLEDRRVTVPGCERAAITSGDVDRRVLASLELLAAKKVTLTVSGAWCLSSSSSSAATAVLRTGNAVASLFANGTDPMVVIRWRDIFESLEAAVDACETVAHALEGISLRRR